MKAFSSLLVPLGVGGIIISAGAVHATWRAPGDPNVATSWPAFLLLLAAFCLPPLVLGLPRDPRSALEAVGTSIVSAVFSTGAVALVLLFFPEILPRFVLLLVAIGGSVWFVLLWSLHRQLVSTGQWSDRVVAVLSDRDAHVLRTDANAEFPLPEQQFVLVETLTPDCALEELLAASERCRPTVLVLGAEAQRNSGLLTASALLHAKGVRVRTLESFYEQWLGKLPLTELSRMALLSDVRTLHRKTYPPIKRFVDVSVASLGLIPLCLVTPAVLIGNALANRGPLFFRQVRVGRDGTPFIIIKLRTMRATEVDDHTWTALDDPRITTFGRFLRRTHLDELPQVLNILSGSLSLVGPRPEQPSYASELQEKYEFYEFRNIVKPGLTGWAQVKFRYASTEAEAFEKLQYDLWYIRRQSPLVDSVIVWRTARRMIGFLGR